MRTVAIIGGGFSGALAAVNLVRLSSSPINIKIINHTHPLARGVAYGTDRGEYILNVAARNMSAVPDFPNHFLEWLRTRVEFNNLSDSELREAFAPRRVYGDYISSTLLNYMSPIDEHHPATVSIIEGEALDIQQNEDGSAEVLLKDGHTISADRVLLATGNQPPAAISEAMEQFSHPAYCINPWGNWQQQIPDPSSTIITLGTGLTMIDAILSLNELGWKGKIISVSRNGLLPGSHFKGIEYNDFPPEHPEDLGLEKLAALIEEHCKRLEEMGENPAIVVDKLRPHTQHIWRKFTLDEKRDFIRNYAHRWNVIRHRIAQPIHKLVTDAIDSGQLQIVKGTVTALSESGDNVRVNLQTRSGEEQTLEGGLVINCTGPRSSFSNTTIPLYQNLLKRGLVRCDELDMGIDVAEDFSVVDSEGDHSEFLYAIGPLMKGTLWESLAVPELRGQAMRVAQLLVDEAAEVIPGHDYRASVEEEHVIEYYI